MNICMAFEKSKVNLEEQLESVLFVCNHVRVGKAFGLACFCSVVILSFVPTNLC